MLHKSFNLNQYMKSVYVLARVWDLSSHCTTCAPLNMTSKLVTFILLNPRVYLKSTVCSLMIDYIDETLLLFDIFLYFYKCWRWWIISHLTMTSSLYRSHTISTNRNLFSPPLHNETRSQIQSGFNVVWGPNILTPLSSLGLNCLQ